MNRNWEFAEDEKPKSLTKFKGSGKRLKSQLQRVCPPHLNVLFSEKGSYREEHVLEALNFLLDAVKEERQAIHIYLDWYRAHLTHNVRNCIKATSSQLKITSSRRPQELCARLVDEM